MDLKTPHVDWLRNRGLDPILAEKFGLHSVKEHDRYWLAWPYIENGKTINHKYRVTSEKHAQRMDQGAPLTLFNHDCLLDESLKNTPLIIVEGEPDCLALIQSGFKRVVSVPNGAPAQSNDDESLREGARYAWFWRCRELLADVSQVILCVDNDDPGKALAADLCRLFGPERCMFVTYPEHCKDANDVLLYNPTLLHEMLQKAKPYPVKGLYQIDDYPEQQEYTKYPTGLAEVDNLFQIVPRTFTVVTGWAGNGKTSFIMWIIANLIQRQIHVTIASFETDIKPVFARKLRATLLRRGEYSPSEESEREWADGLVSRYVAFISHDPEGDDDSLSIEDVLDLAEASVIRNGTRVLIVDPWNEVDHRRGQNENETEYTSRSIRMIKRFSKRRNVATWIIAHPSKPFGQGPKPKLPGLYDISGSAHWANKADYGISFQIKNRDLWTMVLAVTKVRMGLPGKPGQLTLQFNPNTSSYSVYSGNDEGEMI